tara:strand:- start:272 stop:649 length:378 start_codon:yes stop_codon:yes gene_type:complete
MKPKVYYLFKESIKNRKDYLRRMKNYFWYREMYISSQNMLFKRKPFISLFLWFLNLPINTWRYIIFLQDKYDCERAQVDIEIMQNFIKEVDKKHLGNEKFINGALKHLEASTISKNKSNENGKYH